MQATSASSASATDQLIARRIGFNRNRRENVWKIFPATTPAAKRIYSAKHTYSAHAHQSPVRCLTVRQMIPQTNSGSASIKPASVPAKSMMSIPISAPKHSRIVPTICRVSRRAAGAAAVYAPALSLSGASPRAASGCALSPFTSSSSVTPNSSASRRSLSSSGMLASVSHLLTDWRLTSSASARSPCDRFFCARSRAMFCPRVIGVLLCFDGSSIAKSRGKVHQAGFKI